MARLGRDAEIRYTATGEAVCNLSLAVSVFDKSAENNRGTQWIEGSLWGKQAEALAQYMVKGSLHCFTLSDLKLETYQGNSGAGHKLTARVDSVELGPRVANDNGGGSRAPAPAPRAAAPAPRAAAPAPAPRPAAGFDDMDDDIPF
jgi:single-strand DNA-binding protein